MCSPTTRAIKETAYPLHLSRREPISFAYHKALAAILILIFRVVGGADEAILGATS
jgi:hypothetical protein